MSIRNRRRDTGSLESGSDDHGKEKVELKREIGLFGGIALVVGTMIGSGIFLSPKSILRNVESVGASLFVWAGTGALATMGALTFIELGLMIKESGGEYPYLRAAFGDMVAFIYTWVSVLVLKPSSFSIISVGFAQYVTAPFYPGCEPPMVAQKCAACFAILVITLVNCFSVKATNVMQIVFTIAKLLIVVAISIGGFVMIGNGNTQYLTNTFEGTTNNPSAVALAFYSGLWAYDGWNQLNYITEELENPKRNMPLCICIGVPLVTVLYLLVNVAYFTVMSSTELLSSSAVAITFGDRVFGIFTWTVPLAVACSTFGAANGSAFASARLTYAAGRNGHVVKILSYVSVERLTPSPAAIFNAFIAIIMLIPEGSTFESLIDYFSFASWIFYGATFLAVIVLRYRRPNMKRPFKVYIAVPVICFLCSIYLVIAPIIDNPAIEYLYAGIFIIAGPIVYFPFVYYKKSLPYMDEITIFLQKLLEVVPPPKYVEDNEEEDETDEKAL